jgi:hypothetical protein
VSETNGSKDRLDRLEASHVRHVSIECEKVETKLLTEFHKWGRTADMRTRQAITDTGLLGERMLAVEDRISALERPGHLMTNCARGLGPPQGGARGTMKA